MTAAAAIHHGALVRYRDEVWRVLVADTDPTVLLWLASVADPDRDTLALPAECEVIR